MELAIAKILEQKYPELASGWHLPMWAEVVSIGKPLSGETCTESEPVYAVDLQLLTPDGKPDTDVPVFEQIPLPVPASGSGRGIWGKPAKGTWVELAFAYGRADHPFIRCVLPHGQTIVKMAADSQRWQQSEKAFQQVDAQGNWSRETDKNITDKADKSFSEIAKDMTEQIGNLKKTIAKKHYAGSDSTNIYQLILDLMKEVEALANTAASHGHPFTWAGPAGSGVSMASIDAGTFLQSGSKAAELSGKLDPLVE